MSRLPRGRYSIFIGAFWSFYTALVNCFFDFTGAAAGKRLQFNHRLHLT
jgi:hypothetical protein